MFSPKGWLGALGVLALSSSMGVAHAQTTGLRGEYYVIPPLGVSKPSRQQLFGCKTPVFSRVDPNVDFNWGNTGPVDAAGDPLPQVGTPPADFPIDGYAARWTGTLKVGADNAGPKVFIGNSDDGIRIWVKDAKDGPITGEEAPLVDSWNDQGPADHASQPLTLVAGDTYNVIVEYYENGGGAAAQFKWRTPDQADTDSVAVPTEVLTPAPATTGNTGADTTAPGAISDVAATNVTSENAAITFTAPGNDGATGTAGCYEIRYSNSPLTSANFGQGTETNYGTFLPDAAGTKQTFQLTGLQPIDSYWVAIRAKDAAGNVGPVSNIATFNTPQTAFALPSGTDGQPGAVAYLYSPTPGGSANRLNQVFLNSLFKSADVVSTINQVDAYATDKGLPGDGYAIRYALTLTFPASGTWYFNGRPDDGMRVWVGTSPVNVTTPGVPIIDTWADQGSADHISAPVTVTANTPIYVLVEYYENGGGALSQLKIASSNDPTAFADDTTNLTAGGTDYQMKTYYLKASDFTAQGRIKGQVTNTNGNPVIGSRVIVTDANKVATTFLTNSFGTFSALVGPGAYTLTASGVTPNGVTGLGTLPNPVSATSGQVTNNVNIPLVVKTLPATALPTPVDKAVFQDTFYPAGVGWIDTTADIDANSGQLLGDRITGYFQSKGYTVIDSSGLADFMKSHITSKKPSVVVMATDVFPDTVVDVSSGAVVATGNIVADYLNNGGRIISLADIPLYNIFVTGNTAVLAPNPADQGAIKVLGASASGGTWDVGDQPVLTPAGQTLGLTGTWPHSLRPANPADVDFTLAAGQGGSSGWVKLFGTSPNEGAVIRLLDFNPDMGANPITDANLSDLQKLAEFGGDFSFLTVTPGNCVPGDVTGDSKVNVQDATKVLQAAVGLVTLTAVEAKAGDVTGDGKVNVQDATKLLQAAVGLIQLPTSCS